MLLCRTDVVLFVFLGAAGAVASVLAQGGKEDEVTYDSQVRPSVAGCICAIE